ncbi:hypothetical protein AA0116_g8756 [Alternaria tenuissima]|jgi:hypothetical protein|nr:hypothetical protein AA0116_g8756 [Alternaria tenuissima]
MQKYGKARVWQRRPDSRNITKRVVHMMGNEKGRLHWTTITRF